MEYLIKGPKYSIQNVMTSERFVLYSKVLDGGQNTALRGKVHMGLHDLNVATNTYVCMYVRTLYRV